MQNQIYVFIVFILNGFLIGIVFDCFRILRRSFKTPDIVTYFEDILFGIITGLLMLYSIFKFNNGEIRFYLILGIFIGLLIYLSIFSKIFRKICIFILSILKEIFNYAIIIPLKFIIKLFKKIFFKPIIFVCISFKKGIKNIKRPFFKIKRKKKQKVEKSDEIFAKNQ